jgi:hypothetical protein
MHKPGEGLGKDACQVIEERRSKKGKESRRGKREEVGR